MSSFVTQIDLNLADKIKRDLTTQGFSLSQPTYTVFQGKKKGVVCTLYTSGKLMVQGQEMKQFIEFYLEPEILKTFTFGYEEQAVDLTPRIGIDESGKGDYFGPLCIAGVYADSCSIPRLAEIGVKDSKKLSDTSILKIAQTIRKHYIYHVVRIGPERYNQLYEQFNNLNFLLGWGHATAIEHLIDKTGCEQVIVDQFAAEHVVEQALRRKKKKALLTQRTKAEQDLVVAAASILARAAFVEGLEKLGKKWEVTFPKGAGQATIQTGKRLITKHGEQTLELVAKLHFKTTQAILTP